MFALVMAVVVEENSVASLEFAVDAALKVVDLNLLLEYLAYFGGQRKSWEESVNTLPSFRENDWQYFYEPRGKFCFSI